MAVSHPTQCSCSSRKEHNAGNSNERKKNVYFQCILKRRGEGGQKYKEKLMQYSCINELCKDVYKLTLYFLEKVVTKPCSYQNFVAFCMV